MTFEWVNHKKLDFVCDFVCKGPGTVEHVVGKVFRRHDGTCDWCLYVGALDNTTGTATDEPAAKLALEVEYRKHDCPNCGTHARNYVNHGQDARCLGCETRWPVKVTNIA